jgi:hypothetical protein
MKKLDELDKKDTWCRGILGHSFCRTENNYNLIFGNVKVVKIDCALHG